MKPVHPQENQQHKNAVKDKDEHLCRHEIAMVALDVLDNAKDASGEDQDARDVERNEVELPSDKRIGGFPRGSLHHSPVEEGADDDKGAKKGKLDKEARDDHVFANVDKVGSSTHETTTYVHT